MIREIHEESAAVARAHYIRALASTQSGWPDAADHAKRALEIYESIGDVTGAANALNNLGYHAFYTGDWGECERCHRSAMAARNEIGDVLGRALASYNLGELLLEQGRVEESETFLRSALADFRGAGHLVGEAASRLTLGRLTARLGQAEEANRQFDRAETIAQSASADEQLVDVAFGRCELALLVGSTDPGTALQSIDPEQLSPIQRARWHMLSALCAAPEERRALLESAIESASAVDALHLVQLGVESLGRLFGTGDERSLTLSERLEMRARPVFRLTA